MSSGCKLAPFFAAASALFAGDLRVCADPNNLPYSNTGEQGFENALARLAAAQLHRPLRYLWLPQSEKSFQALATGQCDVLMQVPAKLERVRTTRPYYRSSYVFVTRRDRGVIVRSFDDPHLRSLRIGAQVFGSDSPPARALSSRGIVGNITWFTLYQNHLSSNRPQTLIDAVARGDVDVAVAWGPLAGYYARSSSTPLILTPVSQPPGSSMPFAFDISMGVRTQDAPLAAVLDRVLRDHRGEVRHILAQYGVPVIAPAPQRFSAR